MPPTLEAKDLEGDVQQEPTRGNGRPEAGAVELRSTVPASARSIAFVRGCVRGFAASSRTEGLGPPGFDAERAADLALVYTELITNAVLHSGCGPDEALEVRLVVAKDAISGSVTDPGRGFSALRGARTPRVDGGLGLFIVDRLVREWGVRDVGGRTEVWFEL